MTTRRDDGADEPRCVVHALLGVKDGLTTDEASRECLLSEVGAMLAELDAAAPTWLAITVVHIEDWPKIMMGAHTVYQGKRP